MTAKELSVFATHATHYVLPSPLHRAAGEGLVVVPPRDPEAMFRRGEETARQLGDRLAMLAEHQQLLLAELRERLVGLDAEVVDASRARWRGVLREALAVLDWVDTAQQDLVREARLAQTGAEPVDLAALCCEVAQRVSTPDQPVYVSGEVRSTLWGHAAALAGLVREALAVVADRTLGRGARWIEVFEDNGTPRVAVRSTGAPSDALETETVTRFRRACAATGATVRPGEGGPEAAGLVLELPGYPGG